MLRITAPDVLKAEGFTLSAGPNTNPLIAEREFLLTRNSTGGRICGSRLATDICVAGDAGFPVLIFDRFNADTTEFGLQYSRVFFGAGDDTLEFTVVGNSGTSVFTAGNTQLVGGTLRARLGFRDTVGLISVSVKNLRRGVSAAATACAGTVIAITASAG